jgi:hypothetical protein
MVWHIKSSSIDKGSSGKDRCSSSKEDRGSSNHKGNRRSSRVKRGNSSSSD